MNGGNESSYPGSTDLVTVLKGFDPLYTSLNLASVDDAMRRIDFGIRTRASLLLERQDDDSADGESRFCPLLNGTFIVVAEVMSPIEGALPHDFLKSARHVSRRLGRGRYHITQQESRLDAGLDR